VGPPIDESGTTATSEDAEDPTPVITAAMERVRQLILKENPHRVRNIVEHDHHGIHGYTFAVGDAVIVMTKDGIREGFVVGSTPRKLRVVIFMAIEQHVRNGKPDDALPKSHMFSSGSVTPMMR
jgi:hypothetical protein